MAGFLCLMFQIFAITTELQIIFSCLEHILITTHSPSPSLFLIISGSLAVLSAIAQPSSLHPLVTRIHSLLTIFTATSIPVTFIWTPSHEGIPGNENDSAAKQTLLLPSIGLIFGEDNIQTFSPKSKIPPLPWSSSLSLIHI